MNAEALFLSLRLAATVSFLLLVLALPLAYGLAFSTWRGKFLVESVVALPLVLPCPAPKTKRKYGATLGVRIVNCGPPPAA